MLLLSGIQKFTVLDFPGRIACIAFLPGCDFRCGFCHNSEFVLPQKIREICKSFVAEKSFLNFLEKRRGLLDGVVISGGEPTLNKNLPEFIRKIKEMNFLVKLDSNGNNPKVLEELMAENLVDYIALDFKINLEKYSNFVGKNADKENLNRSLQLLKSGKFDYEIRSTLIKEIHSEQVLEKMSEELKGVKRLFLQKFRSGNTLDAKFAKFSTLSEEDFLRAKKIFEKNVTEVFLR